MQRYYLKFKLNLLLRDSICAISLSMTKPNGTSSVKNLALVLSTTPPST